jgi:cytochrome c-type biogenesis protein CcmE
MNKRMMKVLLSVAVVAGGIGLLVYSSLGHVQYYKMVDELLAEPDGWVDKTLRVHGFVEAGSIQERIVDQRSETTFMVENNGARIRVEHTGPKPDTFKDLSEVVAKGRLVHEGDEYVFYASELMAKCPSKYEGAAQNRNLDSDLDLPIL